MSVRGGLVGGNARREGHVEAKILQTLDEVFDLPSRVALVEVRDSQVLVLLFRVLQQMVEESQQAVSHGHRGAVLAPSCSQPRVLRAEVAVFAAGRGSGGLD
jgi:hypothetical protein